MSPAQFKTWRKSLGLKQKEAAEKLGLKKRMIQYYETGKRDGKKVVIPTHRRTRLLRASRRRGGVRRRACRGKRTTDARRRQC